MNKEINIKIPGQILDYVDTKEHLLDLFNYIIDLKQENQQLKERIDRVLSYLDEYWVWDKTRTYDLEKTLRDIDYILEILKGDSNEKV